MIFCLDSVCKTLLMIYTSLCFVTLCSNQVPWTYSRAPYYIYLGMYLAPIIFGCNPESVARKPGLGSHEAVPLKDISLFLNLASIFLFILTSDSFLASPTISGSNQ